jgi:LacI family transcriptional regulator
MACNDVRGRRVIQACRQLRLAVPDDVAVIGVDKDEVIEALSEVPLSSVIPNSRRIGYEAAALLDRMMAGEKPPRERMLIDPIGVATRQSTDVISVGDPNLAKAMFYIQRNCGEEITIDGVAAFAGLSRSVLQRRFRAVRRETVHQAIVRLRLKRARELLLSGNFPLIDIAQVAGFKSGEYMGVVFKSHFGKTPAQFRKEFQTLGAAPEVDRRRPLADQSVGSRLLEKLNPGTMGKERRGFELTTEFSAERCPTVTAVPF